MTTRKPPGVSFPGWVERQIQTAEAAGAFDDLPGKGKPIAGIDRPQHELSWVANYLRREDVDVAALLPPALALAKEVETLPERLRHVRSETRARRMIEDLNERIAHAHAQPADGPPMRVKIVNVDAALDRWRSDVAEAVTPAAVEPVRAPAQPKRAHRHRWFGRRQT
jgi:hypothetical protein